MSRFTDRVERDLGQIADRATPSSAAWSSILQRIADQDHPRDTEVIMLSPDRNDSSRTRRGLLVAAAVATIALLGALLVVATRSDDDGIPADRPDQEAPDPVDVEPVPTVAVDPAAAAAVGEQFVDAFAVRDPDAAIAQLSATPQTMDVFGVTDPDDLPDLFAWFDVVDTTFEPQGCDFREPDQVSCTVAHSNAWYGPVDLAPVEGNFSIKVDDGQIVAVRWGIGPDHAMSAFDPFVFYVNDTNPDDLQTMFKTAATGDFRYPELTDESLALFEKNTAAYLQANGDEGAADGDGAAAASPSDLIGRWAATNRAPGTTWEVGDEVIAANLVVGGSSDMTRESVETEYTATDTTLEMGDETGTVPCPAGQVGIYEWAIDGDVLTVTLVSDGCQGRAEHNDGMTLERTP